MSQPSRRSGTEMARYDPFAEFNRLATLMARGFEGRWPEFPTLLGREGFAPPADVEETDDAYLIDLDLPEVDKDDIEIEVTGRRLSVTGERKEKERAGVLRRQTRTVGRFRYEVTLPEQVNSEGIDANLSDGVLHLRVPKAPTAQRRRIQVK